MMSRSYLAPQQKETRRRVLWDKLLRQLRQCDKNYIRYQHHERGDYWFIRQRMLIDYVWKEVRHNIRLPSTRSISQFGMTNGFVFGYVRR